MYTKISDNVWRKTKQYGLSDTAKILYLYLFTCPHRNMIGLYYIPLAYCSADLDMKLETVSKGFAELQKADILTYDDTEEMVLLHDFLLVNTFDNANVEKKACTVFWELPETQLFRRFADILSKLPKPVPHLMETVSERYQKGMANGMPIQKQNTETEDRIQKTEKETENRIQKAEDSAAACKTAAAGTGALQQERPPAREKHGRYGWVRLTGEEHRRLLQELGAAELERCIGYIDELAQSTGNKNKWRDWNLVLRRCAREGWGKREEKGGNLFLEMAKERGIVP